MKGVLFTEFLALLEIEFGIVTLDNIVSAATPKLSTGGAYTSVGTYPHAELFALIEATVAETQADLGCMLDDYALRLMRSFEQSHPSFFEAHDNLGDFLMNVEGQMHTEVRKLYADAAPPTLEVERIDNETLKLTYNSRRPLSVVVEPLVKAAAARYQTKIDIQRTGEETDGTHSEHIVQIVQ